MLHLAFPHSPTVALCGAALKGITVPGDPPDCIVCAEINRGLR